METILGEADLDLTAKMLIDAREKAPAGTDPVASAILTACATVDQYCEGREVAPAMRRWLAKSLAVFDIVGMLNDPTKQQQSNRDEAWRVLREIKEGSVGGAGTGSGGLAWGSRRRII